VLMQQRRYRAAAEVYQRSLEPLDALLAKSPDNRDYQTQLIDTLAWLADAREYSGQLDEALGHRRRELGLLARQWETDKGNTTVKRNEMTARRGIARLLAAKGDMAGALAQSQLASGVIDWLTRTEPANTEWIQAGVWVNLDRSQQELAANHVGAAAVATQSACEATARLAETDSSVARWRADLRYNCQINTGRVALRQGMGPKAIEAAQEALALARTVKDPVDRGFDVAQAETLLGDALIRGGQKEAARGAYGRALAAWPKGVEERPRNLADRAILLAQLGRQADASHISRQLRSIGYRQPDYLGRVA
jgi:tetratricopeptide (TPR) repeat protein